MPETAHTKRDPSRVLQLEVSESSDGGVEVDETPSTTQSHHSVTPTASEDMSTTTEGEEVKYTHTQYTSKHLTVFHSLHLKKAGS